jgi:hypothetical protein
MKNCRHCDVELEDTFVGLQCKVCKNGLYRYNMNRNDMIALHESQNKCCALCDREVILFNKNKSNSAYIDHNHKTGVVRSILCHPCNTILGYIENSLDISRIVNYLVP